MRCCRHIAGESEARRCSPWRYDAKRSARRETRAQLTTSVGFDVLDDDDDGLKEIGMRDKKKGWATTSGGGGGAGVVFSQVDLGWRWRGTSKRFGSPAPRPGKAGCLGPQSSQSLERHRPHWRRPYLIAASPIEWQQVSCGDFVARFHLMFRKQVSDCGRDGQQEVDKNEFLFCLERPLYDPSEAPSVQHCTAPWAQHRPTCGPLL